MSENRFKQIKLRFKELLVPNWSDIGFLIEHVDQLLQRNSLLELELKAKQTYIDNIDKSNIILREAKAELEKENESLRSGMKFFDGENVMKVEQENERLKKEVDRYAWEHGQQVDFERKRDAQIADFKIMETNYRSVSKAFDEAVQSEASLKQRLSVLRDRAESLSELLRKFLKKTEVYLHLFPDDKELAKYRNETFAALESE